MEEEISSGAVGRKWGVIFGLISAIIFVTTAATRAELGSIVPTVLAWGIVITMFVLANKEYRSANGGFMSFGKGFGINMMVALIGGIVRSVIDYVYILFDSDYLTFAKELRESQSFGPPQDANQPTPSWMEFFNTAEFIAIATFLGAIFAGLIFGAIVAAIMKNEAEEF